MKIVIVGGRAEGKTRLLEVIRRRVLDDYGSECHIVDGGHFNGRGDLVGQHETIKGGRPKIEVFITNNVGDAERFLKTKEI